MQARASSAPSTASASAPVDMWVLLGLALRATPTAAPERVVDGLGVPVAGTLVVGVVEPGVVVGATVPGWAPLAGVVVAGVVGVGVDEVGVVEAGVPPVAGAGVAGVVVVPWTRAEAGIGRPRGEFV
jgi:hypothetical protein